MKDIYINKVKSIGVAVEDFRDAGMFIIFGDNAPAELKDYCYGVSVNPINGEIKPGQFLMVDDYEYLITAVGEEAPVTLKGLGHCTFRFNGSYVAELPGTIYLEQKSMPIVKEGSIIRIVEK